MDSWAWYTVMWVPFYGSITTMVIYGYLQQVCYGDDIIAVLALWDFNNRSNSWFQASIT